MTFSPEGQKVWFLSCPLRPGWNVAIVGWLVPTVPPYCISLETLFIVCSANMSEWSCTGEKFRQKQRCCRCAQTAAGWMYDPRVGLNVAVRSLCLTFKWYSWPFSVLQSQAHNLRPLKCSRNLIHNDPCACHSYTLKLHRKDGFFLGNNG